MQTDELLDLINKTVSPVKAETGKYENNGSDAYSNIEKGADCIQNIDPAVTNDDNTNVGAGNVQSYDNASSCRDVVNDEPACEVHYSHESRTIGEQSSNAESVLHQGQSSVCGTLIKEEPPDQTDTEQSSVCNTLMKVEQSDQNDIQTLDYSKCSSCGNSIIQSNLTDELKKTQKELESTKRSVVRVERQLEKADSYNNVLRNMVEQLSGEIHRYKNAKTQSISIQVDQDDFLNYITGDYTMPLWNADGHSTLQTSEGQGEIAIADPMEQSQSDQALAEPLSIADSVKAAAEAVVQQQTNEALLQSGYVYDDQSGHYYHTETGYYYNTEKGLYYDPTSYTYFYYNYDTGEYQFHSKVDPSEYYNIQTQATPNNQLTQDQKAILAKKKKEKKKKKAKLEDDKEKRMAGALTEFEEAFKDLTISQQTKTARKHALEIAGQWPPCIRMIVTESDCVDIGMLYLVTCSGATIGREGDRKHDIPLPDINISKWHAEIKFNTDKRQYEIVDKGSQNGTFVNDERLSVAKETSSPRPLIHGDKVQLGDSKLLCHIHMGTDTCDDCEPGIVMARHKALQPLPEVKILSAEEKKKIQKDQMKEIKKKYGLKNANYEVHKSLRNTDYANRAEERRQTVGSDTPGVKQTSAPASVHRPISTENVGHKLLQKMGWKAGESLGKSNTGIQEPISVTLRANQAAGLGSATAGSFSADAANTVDLKKASRRAQAQQRYNKIDNHTNQQSDDRDSKSKEMEVARESKRKGLTWCKGDTEFT